VASIAPGQRLSSPRQQRRTQTKSPAGHSLIGGASRLVAGSSGRQKRAPTTSGAEIRSIPSCMRLQTFSPTPSAESACSRVASEMQCNGFEVPWCAD